MKILYIIGLEHSGTTLADCLISGNSGCIGIGEVANYFSVEHMKHYHSMWGNLDDAYICSCRRSEESCVLWRHVHSYSGLRDDSPSDDKYKTLLNAVSLIKGEDAIIVDSSKSIKGLDNWLSLCDRNILEFANLRVVFAIKDPRAFAASMVKKEPSNNSLLSLYRHMNYWRGANQSIVNGLRERGVEPLICRYKDLCESTKLTLENLTQGFIDLGEVNTSLKHENAHVLVGNKSFIMRNREAINYDDSWTRNKKIKLAYTLNLRVRQMNAAFNVGEPVMA